MWDRRKFPVSRNQKITRLSQMFSYGRLAVFQVFCYGILVNGCFSLIVWWWLWRLWCDRTCLLNNFILTIEQTTPILFIPYCCLKWPGSAVLLKLKTNPLYNYRHVTYQLKALYTLEVLSHTIKQHQPKPPLVER